MQKDLVEDIEHRLAEIARSEVLQSVLWQRVQTFMRTRDLLVLPGLPAISVPCGFTRNGLPVGLQIVGRGRQEAAVLRAAAAYEAAAARTGYLPPLVTAVTTGQRRPRRAARKAPTSGLLALIPKPGQVRPRSGLRPDRRSIVLATVAAPSGITA